MRETDSTVEGNMPNKWKQWSIYALILLIVFLLGFVPMWLQKREVSQNLDLTQKQLQKSEIKGLLTTAIVEARRGEYEPARKDTSDFYTRLRAELDKGETSAYSKEEQAKINSVFNNRDAMITMLAQRDQASVERLNDVYSNYQTATGQMQLPSASPTQIASPIPTQSPIPSPSQ